ncbi:MAG: hypothetical protein ACREM2_00980 [Vulcanimicrobiaceae bacterium]
MTSGELAAVALALAALRARVQAESGPPISAWRRAARREALTDGFERASDEFAR